MPISLGINCYEDLQRSVHLYSASNLHVFSRNHIPHAFRMSLNCVRPFQLVTPL